MSDSRLVAYTTPRPDIFGLVPVSCRNILDVGCSNGALGASLRHAVPGRRVVGVDYDPAFVTEAAERLDRSIQADLNHFDWAAAFGDDRFDCIIFADVLEHLVSPEQVLVAARDFLSPGGCVVMSVPNIRHISALFSIFGRGTFPRRDRGIFDRTHLRWFCVNDAKHLLADSGFQVEQMHLSLRWGDKGGGRMNRLLGKLPAGVAGMWLVREWLAYQVCLRASPRLPL